MNGPPRAGNRYEKSTLGVGISAKQRSMYLCYVRMLYHGICHVPTYLVMFRSSLDALDKWRSSRSDLIVPLIPRMYMSTTQVLTYVVFRKPVAHVDPSITYLGRCCSDVRDSQPCILFISARSEEVHLRGPSGYNDPQPLRRPLL